MSASRILAALRDYREDSPTSPSSSEEGPGVVPFFLFFGQFHTNTSAPTAFTSLRAKQAAPPQQYSRVATKNNVEIVHKA
jgi:hypothetical protein